MPLTLPQNTSGKTSELGSRTPTRLTRANKEKSVMTKFQLGSIGDFGRYLSNVYNGITKKPTDRVFFVWCYFSMLTGLAGDGETRIRE